jgi:hypothetical protein
MAALCKRRRHVHERGQALIETALVLPFILILLIVIVDFGMALDRREVIIHSLREAGRSAAAGDTSATVVSRAVNESDGVLDASDVEVCYLDENGNSTLGDAGDVVSVGIDYDFSLSVGGGEMLSAAGITFPTIPISPKAEVLLIKDTSEASPAAC